MDYAELFFKDYALPETLSKKDSVILFKKMHNGDMDARKVLAETNIKLVIFIIKEHFYNTRYDKGDMFSLGMIGLMKAIDSFDYTKNIEFSTFAARCIYNEIGMVLRKNKNKVLVTNFSEIINMDEDGNVLTLEDTLYDEDNFTFDIEDKELYDKIRSVIDELPDFEREVVKLFFGFYDKRYTQAEIANKLNYSQSYISRLLTKVLKNIRTMLINNGLFNEDNAIIKKKMK